MKPLLLACLLLCPALAVVAEEYKLGPDSLERAPGVPKGRVEKFAFADSKVFPETTRDGWIYIPSQYDGSKPAALMVFQDGGGYVGETGQQRVPIVFDNLIAKEEMPVTIGVFINPGMRGANGSNRSFEYDSLGGAYAKFLIDELLPFVVQKYSVKFTDDPDLRAICGMSSGAICAFTVAWERPDQFRKVISCIGSFTDIKGGHVFPQLIKDSAKKPIRVFIEDTNKDNPSPNNPKRDWHLQNIAMVEALKEKGYDFTHVFADGNHSDAHGGSIMPDMLRWIWRDAAK